MGSTGAPAAGGHVSSRETSQDAQAKEGGQGISDGVTAFDELSVAQGGLGRFQGLQVMGIIKRFCKLAGGGAAFGHDVHVHAEALSHTRAPAGGSAGGGHDVAESGAGAGAATLLPIPIIAASAANTAEPANAASGEGRPQVGEGGREDANKRPRLEQTKRADS